MIPFDGLCFQVLTPGEKVCIEYELVTKGDHLRVAGAEQACQVLMVHAKPGA